MRKLMVAVVYTMIGVGCSSDAPSDAAGLAGASTASDALMPVAQAQGPLPSGVLRLKPTQIMDARGFERPLVAAVALAPVGWRSNGGYEWNTSDPCATGDVLVNWSLIAPDGISAIAFVSKPRWETVQTFIQFDRGPPGPCESGNWTSAQQYLEALARQAAPEARILDYQNRPDLIKELEAMLKSIQVQSSDLVQMRTRLEAGQILFAHSVNGREVREMISATVMFTETRFADLLNPGRLSLITTTASPSSVVYARAPAGQLNLQLPSVISKSVRWMADWSSRVHKHNMEKQERAFQAMLASGKIAAADRERSFAAHQQKMAGLRETQAQRDRLYDQNNIASDRQQREWVETVRGVETYHEPVEGGVVQLDNTFDHAWRVRDGSYLLTNDPNFRPGQIGIEGQELSRVQ